MIVIGSPHTYLSRNWCAIVCPILTSCYWIPITISLRHSHINYVKFVIDRIFSYWILCCAIQRKVMLVISNQFQFVISILITCPLIITIPFINGSERRELRGQGLLRANQANSLSAFKLTRVPLPVPNYAMKRFFVLSRNGRWWGRRERLHDDCLPAGSVSSCANSVNSCYNSPLLTKMS